MHANDPSGADEARPSPESPSPSPSAISAVLREARRLHRAATSDQLATALPVLRRMVASQVVPGIALPQWHRERHRVQRKHVLRMLALEAGHASWERYREALATVQADELRQFDLVRHEAGHLNLWFSTMAEAEAHVRLHGGRAYRAGPQAVVLGQH